MMDSMFGTDAIATLHKINEKLKKLCGNNTTITRKNEKEIKRWLD